LWNSGFSVVFSGQVVQLKDLSFNDAIIKPPVEAFLIQLTRGLVSVMTTPSIQHSLVVVLYLYLVCLSGSLFIAYARLPRMSPETGLGRASERHGVVPSACWQLSDKLISGTSVEVET
jgi:hypothetical protein